MAIINKITGYYGFTIDTDPENPSINSNGEVSTCIVAITYPNNEADVNFTISNGHEDFAVKTGDGQIIPCFEPQVIYVNRDNAIIQFEMESEYPANSPLTLVYRSDTAGFLVDPVSGTTRPFEVNSVSGHFAYTIEGYKGTEIKEPDFNGSLHETGNVTKVMAVVPFTYSITSVSARMSNGVDDWGIRMGNGSIIPLQDPEIVSVNKSNFVALLTMQEGYSYPSNSPGILVYRSETARIDVIPQDDDDNFYPVRNIYDVPTEILSGSVIDLNCAKVEPFNASIQEINWSVVSGNAKLVDKHYLHILSSGPIVINGTIENGLGGDDDLNNDYNQRFNITSIQNVITKLSDPIPEIKLYVGEVNHTIAVVAESLTNQISFQWYENDKNSYNDARIIGTGFHASYDLPSDLRKGDTYYFCEIRSDGATMVRSKICHVYASIRCTNIAIIPSDNTMYWEDTRQFQIVQYPNNADLPNVKWFSSNDNIASFDEEIDPSTGLLKHNGLLVSKFPEIKSDLSKVDTITITAVTTDILGNQLSATLDLMIETFVPVTDIVGLTLDVNPNKTYTLSANVLPDNATNKDIEWSLVDGNHSDVYINGNILTIPNSVIPKDHQLGCMIRGTIMNGSTTHNKFEKEFSVYISHGFIPITSISLDNDLEKSYNIGEKIKLLPRFTPLEPSVHDVSFNLISGNGELYDDTLVITGSGDIRVRATAYNGGGSDKNRTNVVQEFVFKSSGYLFIPVESVDIIFSHTGKMKNEDGSESTYTYEDNCYIPFEEGKNPTTLPYTINPSNATNKNIEIRLIGIIEKEMTDSDNTGEEEFWNTGWSNANMSLFSFDPSTNEISVNLDLIPMGFYYQAIFSVKIKDGIAEGNDYIDEIPIRIECEKRDPFIPLEDVQLKFPSVIRTYYPILLSRYDCVPFDASSKVAEYNKLEVIDVDFERTYRENEATCVSFFTDVYQLFHTLPPLSIFNWCLEELYLYTYRPGLLNLTIHVPESTVADVNNFNKYYPTKIDFDKKYEDIEVLPPFIPVKKIKNIPGSIKVNQPVILCPEISTEGGLDCYNPCWDEEEASYQSVVWSIVSDTAGCSLSGDGRLLATREGQVTIKATINQGTQEALTWYGLGTDMEAIAYEELFTINVAGTESNFSRAIVKLTFSDGSSISIFNKSDLALLCNDKGDTENITIGSTTFRKNQIVRVDFWDDIYVPITLTTSSPVDPTTPGVTESVIGREDTSITITQNTYSNPYSEEWTVTKNYVAIDANSGVSISQDGANRIVNFDHSKLSVGDTIRVACKIIKTEAEKDTTTAHLNIVFTFTIADSRPGSYEPGPDVTSLKNFGRNFTSLTSINCIPTGINGNQCLMNFMRGCTSFNGAISIPENISGEECMKYFMRDCVSFNNPITIPANITGKGCLHGFLYGCKAFNRDISIPSTVTGESCLERFLYGCSSFNKPIVIPNGVSGYACLRSFMAHCTLFNYPITLPNDVGDFGTDAYGRKGRHLCNMLEEAKSFCSQISVPAATGLHAQISPIAFSSMNYNCNLVSIGVTFVGDGASNLVSTKRNSYKPNSSGELSLGPWCHITNLD